MTVAFVQCAKFDTASQIVSTCRTAEAVTTPANLFEKRGAGLIGGVFPGSFELTDRFLLHICIFCLISMVYVGYYEIFNVAVLNYMQRHIELFWYPSNLQVFCSDAIRRPTR